MPYSMDFSEDLAHDFKVRIPNGEVNRNGETIKSYKCSVSY